VNEPMEIVKETKEKDTEIRDMNEEEVAERVETLTMKAQTKLERQRDNEAKGERIMRQLIQEWKNLDERFIPKTQKQIYKEEFQK